MFKTSEIRGTFRDNIRFTRMRGDALFQQIKTLFPDELRERGIPFKFREDVMKSGGLFGSKSPMLLIWHPAPPTQFFSIGIVVNDNVVSFVALGASAQNTKKAQKAEYEAEGKHIRAAMIHPDEFILQQESAWRNSVLDAFDAITTD